MADLTTDFCIVGGGPAGLTLALLLVRSGARVVLIERSPTLEREYRGEILQPGGMSVLDSLGVLGPARLRGSREHDRFRLVEHGRTLIDGDYRALPGPFNHLLSIPQEHVLGELLDRCRRYHHFTYVEGSKVVRLLRDGSRATGVVCEGRGGRHVVAAHCFVGADGRYSKMRQLAGIRSGRLDVFDYDVLWFKIPDHGRAPKEVRILRAGGNPVLTYASMPGSVQIGWTLPHKRYRAIAAQGVDHVKAMICAAIPEYAAEIQDRITRLSDLTLLDVFAGCAEEWAQDGLVLIGDSAHTHSPIGAQGINLAVQDAVALHPVLMRSLEAGDAGAAFLNRYVVPRRRDITRIMRLQVTQSKVMLSTGRASAFIRPKMAAIVSRTPIYRKVLRQLAFGNEELRVSSELFTDEFEMVE
jgi:6-methylpretetramide 4-monooxygenase